ncbi:hypothetical protein N7492_002333 [Penicillium capsulatum]|uniref:Uncharacterized protein n=1 Tax=Penicillium capsulatum TaxID=69766 RepID=A0A9W9LV17_9EURO|nr:hypothetical protein N7492_002333 [Penicillium capsulatum]KAJ6123061.1 hypothetical protein N7512_005526 [Penicillium capsulatum]
MKLNILALSALLALAAAADSTTSEVAKTTSSAEVECDTKDLCCIAACYKVPCPSDNQANDTNSCVAACPQGTGTPSDTQKYADCEQKCFSSHFFPATGGAAATHASSKTSTASESNATETKSDSSASGTSSTHGTTSASSSGAAQTTNAANNIKLGASGAGLFGLVLAAFAL